MVAIHQTGLPRGRGIQYSDSMGNEVVRNFEVTLMSFFSALVSVWNFQLTVVDASPITLGTVIKGITLLILGYFICRTLAKEIEKRLLVKLDIDPSLRSSLQTVIFYFLQIILTFFILALLNIPIGIFALVGGALAIGVGFGSQNIINNFISGLILMIERPLRVGDIIEVEGLQGRVEHIGARSTKVKSMNNTSIVVPNSSFLEKNVLNWTLSDDVVRGQVSVGVAYGSHTDVVKEILTRAANENQRILKYPEPLVLFAEFGDNSLNFELFYWTKVSNVLQLRALASEVRFMVDDLFRESNVVISFPQRDVHLDTLRPLQVELKNTTYSNDSPKQSESEKVKS